MNIDHRLFWLAGLAVIILSGCVGFDSEHPLSDPASAQPDQQLIGSWQYDDAPKVVYKVSLAGEGFPAGMLRMDIVDGKHSDSGLFFVSKVGDDQYINMVNLKDDKELPKKWDRKLVLDYGLMGYRVVDDQWQLIPANEIFLKKAIESKQILGEVVHDDDLDLPDELQLDNELDEPENLENVEMRLTADTATLRDFFNQNRDKVLEKEFESLSRVK